MGVDRLQFSGIFYPSLISRDYVSWGGSQPISLSQIEITGGEKFSNDFFNKIFKPLLQSRDSTLEELMNDLNSSYDKLIKTNVFKDVSISVTSDYKHSAPTSILLKDEKPIVAKILLGLVPINLNSGEVFLNFNSEENLSLNLDYLNSNFNGNAELVQCGVKYNPYKPYELLIGEAKFLAALNNPSMRFVVDVSNDYLNNQAWQLSSEKVSKGLIGIQSFFGPIHSLTGASLTKISLHDVDAAASDDTKFSSGEFVKSSLVSRINYSGESYLNDKTKNFPVSGLKLKLDTELSTNQEQANPSNQMTLVKSALGLESFKSFFSNFITTKLSADVGFLLHNNSKTPLHVSDRFYLGGIASFPGFSKNAVNLKGDSQFYKAGITVYSKIPTILYKPPESATTCSGSAEANPLRFYATSIMGNVSKEIFRDDFTATSVGFGVKYFNPWANFDVGYFSAARYGGSQAGIQNGLHFAISIGGSNRTIT